MGISGASDTIILTKDFSKILIFFHHDWYELYNKGFAKDFKLYLDCINKNSIDGSDTTIKLLVK